MAHKEKLIEKIKSIIKDYGSFTIGELDGGTSIEYFSLGKIVFLIESFNHNNVEVFTYDSIKDDELESGNMVNYEELSDEILEEIAELAEDWKEEKRIK